MIFKNTASQLGAVFFFIVFKSISYLFWPKYTKAKKDKVLTKAIKYHPVEELLVTSVIQFYFCRYNLLFERKSQLIAIKKLEVCKLYSFIKKC